MAEPRYEPYDAVAVAQGRAAVTCLDCGVLVSDQPAHTRFHSILGGHAWALAVLKTSHISAGAHDKYNVTERINSRQFDNWSADALAEVIKRHGDG